MHHNVASAWRTGFAAGPMHVELVVDDSMRDAVEGLVDGYCGPSDAAVRYDIRMILQRRDGRPEGLPRMPRFVSHDGVSTDRSELWDARVTWLEASATAIFALRDTRHFEAEMALAWEARLQRLWLASAVRTLLALAAPRADALLLHAAALVAPSGRAWLFAGPSEAGKTTMTRRLAGWQVLADDAVLVFREGSDWRVAGTPLHGREHLPRSAASAPLEGLAFLQKGAAVARLTQLGRAEAFSEVLARILYFAEPDERVLSLAEDLANSTGCYHLASSLEHDIGPLLASAGPC